MRNTKLLVIALILVLTGLGIWYFSDLFILLLLGGLLAFLLNPIAERMHVILKIKKGWGILLVFLILFLLLMIVLSTLIPALLAQAHVFFQNLSDYGANIMQYYQSAMKQLERLNIPEPILTQLELSAQRALRSCSSALLTGASSLVSRTCKLLDFLLVLSLAVYFMLDASRLTKRLAALIPAAYRPRFLEIMAECYHLLWSYVRAKTLVSAGTSVITFVVFRIIGVEYALLLALVTFVLDFIPYFGSLIAGGAAVCTALVTSGIRQALILLVCVVVIQQIEGNLVSPKIQGGSVGIHPIAALLAVLACNRLWGPLGMLLSVPLAAMGKIILRELYRFLCTPDD